MRQILVVLVLSLSAVRAHTVEKVDRIIVHKKDHTMELMRAGKVIKTYKIALGRNPVGPSSARETSARPRVFTSSIAEMQRASAIARYTSPIRTPQIASGLVNGASLLWLPRRSASPVGLDVRLSCRYR